MFGGSVLSYLSWQQDKTYPGVAKFGIALEWGSRGRWFESSHSDQKRLEIARFQAFFTLSWHNGIVKLSKSAQESAQTSKICVLSFTNTREMGNGYHLGGAVPANVKKKIDNSGKCNTLKVVQRGDQKVQENGNV